jgi:amidohydrolase
VSSPAAGWLGRLEHEMTGQLPFAAALRRQIHAAPELSGNESATADLVAAAIGAESMRPAAGTGRIIRIGPPGPAVAVRAELDALPIRESTGAAFAARNGAMHACGHDVHLAAITAFARACRSAELPRGVVLVLQPREESSPSGALDILQAGLLDEAEVAAVIGAHVHHAIPARSVSAGRGTVNAASDEFEIVISGRGGHCAYPHLSRDPVAALANVIVGLGQVTGRRVDPMHAALITIGSVTAGTRPNVIPDVATARGSLRAMEQADRELLREVLRQTVTQVASCHGCEGAVTIVDGEPALVNDPALNDTVVPHLGSLGLAVTEPMRSCGADDFAYFAARFPALMIFVGVAGDGNAGECLHSSRFLPAEESVGHVARAMLAGYAGAVACIEARAPAARGRNAQPLAGTEAGCA